MINLFKSANLSNVIFYNRFDNDVLFAVPVLEIEWLCCGGCF